MSEGATIAVLLVALAVLVAVGVAFLERDWKRRHPVCLLCHMRHRQQDGHWQPVQGQVRGYGQAPKNPPPKIGRDNDRERGT